MNPAQKPFPFSDRERDVFVWPVERASQTAGKDVEWWCGILSPKQVKNSEFSFTCKICYYRGDRNRELDIDLRGRLREPYRNFLIDRFPVRCRECERVKKRYQRMNRRMDKIWDESWGFLTGIYKRPKLITYALPSVSSNNYEDRDLQIAKLNSLIPKSLKLLKRNGILGGVFVVECTSRLLPLSEGLFQWKHHAHVHMVALAPYIPKTEFVNFCSILLELGLGRINYQAPRGKNAESKVASYISKYIAKDDSRSRTFGVMRGI